MIKIIAIIVFLIIIASLGNALFHLVKSRSEQESKQIYKALTIRIGLSLLLFIFIFIALATGIIQPHGIGANIEHFRMEKAQHVDQ